MDSKLKNHNRTIVAMSGGVDSSVAAWILKNSGYDCIGAMMKLYEHEDTETTRDGTCCGAQDASDARAVAFRLGIPFYVFNFTDSFHNEVISRFIDAYKNGLTPNPCIDCNRYLKFDRFMHRAAEIGCDLIATGHYAQITKSNGRYLLKKGIDSSKDQSYVLYSMTSAQLEKTRFPLGGMTKTQVREIALNEGFINAKKHDSQDICFVPDGKYDDFIEKHGDFHAKRGKFVDIEGNYLGEHMGIHRYTIGQRKGLGLSAAQPLYVCNIDPETNTVIVGSNDEVFGNTLIARDINLVAVDSIKTSLRVMAKIRYNHIEQPATVWQLDEDTIRVEFDKPQRAITKGQAVVLYDSDIVIGGGTIV